MKSGKAQTSYTWVGTSSTSWNTATNWSPNGIPGAADNVTIVSAANNCTLGANTTVANVTMNSGTFNVGTYTFSSTGITNFLAGVISGTGALNCSGSSVTFGSTTAGPTVSPAVTISTLSVKLSRSTFSSSVNITKTAASSIVDSWRGGNTYNGYFKLINAAADSTGDNGDIWMSTSTTDPTDVYNGRADFYVTGCARIRVPYSGKAIFNGVTRFYSQGYGTQHDRIQPARFNGAVVTFNDSVYLYCTSLTTDVQVAYEAGTTAIFNAPLVAVHYGPSAAEFSMGTDGNVVFNNNIVINNNGSGTISITRGSGSSTLANGKTISVGSLGFNSGSLNIGNFTQVGSTPQAFTLLGTSACAIGSATTPCVFNASVNYTSPSLTVINSTFNSTATFTKTGNAGNNWGGNTFTQAFTLNNSSATGTVALSATMAADVFSSTVDLSVSGAGNTKLSRAFNTVYNNNITVSSSSTGTIAFGDNGFTSTLVAGKTITVGSGGFTNGNLLLYLFNQVGNTAQSVLMSGALPRLRLGSQTAGTQGCTFDGDFTARAGLLEICGNTFNRTSTFTQTGASSVRTWGANTFTGAHIINVDGTGGIQCSQIISADVYLSTVSANLTGTGGITLARTFNTTFNDNITVTNTTTGIMAFGFNGGISTLVAGKTISVGTAGFSAGSLLIYNFNQMGGTPQSLLCTGSSIIQYGPASTFNGNLVSTSGGLLFMGCTYNGTATCTKTGAGNDASTGNNFFNNTTVITNNGTGYLMLGNGNHDEFNATTTFNNTGSANLHVAYNSTGNIFGGLTTFNDAPSATTAYITVAYSTAGNSTFNDQILVNCVNGSGVYFGYSSSGGTGTSALAAGKTISVGAAGFNAGTLRLRNFTQTGATAQNILLTSTGSLEYGPASTFDGNVTSTSPGLLLQGCTFNGTLDCTKNGAVNDISAGNNVYNASTVITVAGTGYERLASTTADDHNADVTFVQTGAGAVLPAFNTNSTFAGNINLNSAAAVTITLAASTSGRVTMDGGIAQSINRISGNVPQLNRFTIAKTAGDVTLNTKINVATNFTPTSGILNTNTTNILNLQAGSVTTVGNASSYVNGPMNYDVAASGGRTLNLPIGKVNDWRPAVLTINHSAATAYTYNAEVFNASADNLNWTLPATVDTVSYVHYWDINRYTTGTTTSVPATGLSGNQTITLYFGSNDLVKDGAYLTVCKNTYTAPGSWIDIGGTGAPAYAAGANLSGNVTSTSSPTAFNSFSRFTLGSRLGGWNPLPIELLSFTAVPQTTSVDLKWITATETNNDHFEIERSTNGSSFEFVKAVSAYGDGNSTSVQTYTSVDEHPYNNTSYYRLKQVDKNGAFTYSDLVAVNFQLHSEFNFYPNPAVNELHFSTKNTTDEMTSLKIMDVTGRIVSAYNNIQNMDGTIDVSALPSGIYSVVTENGSQVKTVRMVIQK